MESARCDQDGSGDIALEHCVHGGREVVRHQGYAGQSVTGFQAIGCTDALVLRVVSVLMARGAVAALADCTRTTPVKVPPTSNPAARL